MRRARILAAVAAIALVVLAVGAPHAAGAGWRAGFVIAGAVPAGAVALLLIAQLTGAAWAPALMPLASPAPLLMLALPGVAVDQWLRPVPPHLALWLGPVPFLVRGAAACGLWWWLSRRAATLSEAGAGLTLLAHGALLALVAPDWLLGVAPGQPFSAIAPVLGVGQIFVGCAAVLAVGAGTAAVRRDLARLMLAGGLGLSYLTYVDYLVIWYGDLPARVAYYAVRTAGGWGLVPIAALLVGLVLPVAAVASGRALRLAGVAALVSWGLLVTWLVLPESGLLAIVATLLVLALAGALPLVVRRA